MQSIVRKTLSVFWLVVITPIFGLIPLLVFTNLMSSNNRIWLLDSAILKDVYVTFFTDLSPGTQDDGPPLTDSQWWMLIAIVMLVAAIAAYDLFKNRKAASTSNVARRN